jgi:hypothetical protein
MVKVVQRKLNKSVRQVLNDITFLDDISTATTTISNINPTDSANVLVADDIENQDYIQQSSVWKFATKIGSEKARCNICQIGKHLEQTMHNYVLREIPW